MNVKVKLIYDQLAHSWCSITSCNSSDLSTVSVIPSFKIPSLSYLLSSKGTDGQHSKLRGKQWVKSMKGHPSFQLALCRTCTNPLTGFLPESSYHLHQTNTHHGTLCILVGSIFDFSVACLSSSGGGEGAWNVNKISGFSRNTAP